MDVRTLTFLGDEKMRQNGNALKKPDVMEQIQEIQQQTTTNLRETLNLKKIAKKVKTKMFRNGIKIKKGDD